MLSASLKRVTLFSVPWGRVLKVFIKEAMGMVLKEDFSENTAYSL